MLSAVKRMLFGDNCPDGARREALIDSLISEVEPRLRSVPRYQRKISAAALKLDDAIEQVVDALHTARPLCLEDNANDPVRSLLFFSPERLCQKLASSPVLSEWREANPDAEACTVLLGAELIECNSQFSMARELSGLQPEPSDKTELRVKNRRLVFVESNESELHAAFRDYLLSRYVAPGKELVNAYNRNLFAIKKDLQRLKSLSFNDKQAATRVAEIELQMNELLARPPSLEQRLSLLGEVISRNDLIKFNVRELSVNGRLVDSEKGQSVSWPELEIGKGQKRALFAFTLNLRELDSLTRSK